MCKSITQISTDIHMRRNSVLLKLEVIFTQSVFNSWVTLAVEFYPGWGKPV